MFVRIDDTSAAILLDRDIKKRFSLDIRDYFDISPAAARQNTENGNLSRCTTTSISFALFSEVRFFQFKFARQDNLQASAA